MLKTIRNIIIISVIAVLLAMIPYMSYVNSSHEQGDLEKDTTIIINDDGTIKVTDEITFTADKSRRCFIVIPRSLDYSGPETTTTIPKNIETTIYQNDKLLNRKDYILSNSEIRIKNIITEKDSVYKFKVNYEYDAINVVEEYNNLSVLKLCVGNDVTKFNIKIQLPQETNEFDLKSNAKVEYLGDNTYNISGKLRKPYTELLLDKGIIKNAKIVDEEYEGLNIGENLLLEDKSILNVIMVFFIITAISTMIVLILTKKVKSNNEYVRNPEEVIEPILAEAIIDRKIGPKELIMSCIVELIYRGNLQNIGNDKIQLLNYEKISKYEKEILGLIFEQEGQIVTFDQIKEIFIKNNKETKKIFNKFKNIRKKIEEKLFDYNIYSKIGEKILNVLKILGIGMILNSLYLWFVATIALESLVLNEFFKAIIINLVIAIIVNKISFELAISLSKVSGFQLFGFLMLICLIPILIQLDFITAISIRAYKHIGATLLIAIILVLNIIILKKSNTHILTKFGKSELQRVQGLKKYIVDYSLMKERELDSVIIWDEYLAYAVAFGIPNKITDKFNENLMNTNIVLQKIEAIFNLM